MFLLAQFLLLAAIAIVVVQFLPSQQEKPSLFQTLFPATSGQAQAYLRASRKRGKRRGILQMVAFFNLLFLPPKLRDRLNADLSLARLRISAEEFLFFQELIAAMLLFFILPISGKQSYTMNISICLATGFFLPALWLRMKTNKARHEVIKALPDIIDLLNLCVNAGLDFMLAMKWVVEKSRPSLLIDELRTMMQEISIGKSRREALLSFAHKYATNDVTTFTRTLIQADRMGTSVSQALDILSEDMRRRRFLRGEQQALKAPLKLLFPLLVFIFPVVGIIIAGPILLQFMSSKAMFGGVGG